MRQSRVGTCSECCDPILARGWCRRHYQRWAKYGDPRKTVNVLVTDSPEERLRRGGWKVTSDGCWEWLGNRFANGYGRVALKDTTVGAHRVAYETWVGPIPEGHLIRHKCDNKPCINPEHLETGTHADNMADKVARGRQNTISGDAHYAAKLTAIDVIRIRREYSEGTVTQMELARRFNVTNKNISMIVLGKTWKKLLDKDIVDIESEESA